MESSIHNSSYNNSLLDSQVLCKHLQALTNSKKFLIAYSGGLDSHVLLHLASQLSQTTQNNSDSHFQVRAMHVHHGLQKDADDWVPHCKQVCDDLDISLTVEHLDLNIEKGESIEEVARSARYLALAQELETNEVLLTAHHQNDQAETLLLQLFRGAGVQGLASMPLVTSFSSGEHIRPLLSMTRDALEEYAEDKNLIYVEDLSNQDSAFDRNYLRNEVLPKLRKRWPSIDKTISRSASIQSETKQILDEVAEQDLLELQKNNTKQYTSKTLLVISALQELSMARQKLVLRYWIEVNGFQSPSEKKLKHIFKDVINSKDDAQPVVEWKGAEIRRFRNTIYLMKPLQGHDNKQVLDWVNYLEPLEVPSLNIVLPALDPSEYNELQSVTVRFRQGGEKFYSQKRGLNASLKNLFNESEIPPWLRSRIPLIYSGDTLVKIVGIE